MAGAVPRVALILVVVVAVVGPVFLLRRFSEMRVLGLSVVACVVAIAFVPLSRALPEGVGLYFFLIAIWPALAIIAVALAGNAVRFAQTHRRGPLAGLAVSVAAACLFYLSLGLR